MKNKKKRKIKGTRNESRIRVTDTSSDLYIIAGQYETTILKATGARKRMYENDYKLFLIENNMLPINMYKDG